MRLAILGTRGIPNHYGGFEQFAEYLAEGLVKRGYQVTVYSSHNHPYKEKLWRGVNIVHLYDPEDQLGTKGQFIYDFNCILHSRSQKYDVILQLGYTSSSIWNWLFPKQSIITTNMDGLEWKRTKFSPRVQKFLHYAEKLAVKRSDYLIADSIGIQDYLNKKYNVNSIYIPYGASNFTRADTTFLAEYALEPYQYNMLIARLEPENSIETILEGVVLSGSPLPFLVVGKHSTAYGEYLKNKFKLNTNIKFTGGIYNIIALNNLRYYSNLYFHGHTVGGTNPSLLEAMASCALVSANDNIFNRSILGDDAFYFNDKKDIAEQINAVKKSVYNEYITRNQDKISKIYSWEKIIDQYEDHFKEIYKAGK
jgi:glycosyltransferase involved in cell wall biosynthesis